MLSIYDLAGYASRWFLGFVPEIVPVRDRIRLGNPRDIRPMLTAEKAAVSFSIKHTAKRLTDEDLLG
jgi:hypothetical protein